MKITAITRKTDVVTRDFVWVNNDDTAPAVGDVMLAVGSIMQAFANTPDNVYGAELAGITVEFGPAS